MDILLLGKNGQLAKVFREYLDKNGADYVSLDRTQCDVTDRETVLRSVAKAKPRVIINATGYVLVDKMESDGREEGFKINVDGVRHIAEAAADTGAKLVHFGTDYVFDGEQRHPYTEEDKTNPLGAYGQSKLEGDLEALAYPASLILRVSWLYGPGENNFVRKFIAFNEGKTHNKITGDEVSIPTHASTLTTAAFELLEGQASGIFHICDQATDAGVSRADWGRAIAKLRGMDIEFEEVAMSSWNLPAKRPLYSVLSTKKATTLLDHGFPDWEENLARFVRSLPN